MPKLLITEGTLINYADDRGGVHADAGDITQDVPKDTARKLVDAGRALYVDSKDDPRKDKADTATAEQIKAAQSLAAAKAKKGEEKKGEA